MTEVGVNAVKELTEKRGTMTVTSQITEVLNDLSFGELNDIDGIGPETANEIERYREEWEGFRGSGQVTEIPGIGPETEDKLISYITCNYIDF